MAQKSHRQFPVSHRQKWIRGEPSQNHTHCGPPIFLHNISFDLSYVKNKTAIILFVKFPNLSTCSNGFLTVP